MVSFNWHQARGCEIELADPLLKLTDAVHSRNLQFYTICGIFSDTGRCHQCSWWVHDNFFFFFFEKEFVSRNFSTFGYATFRHYVCDEFKRVPLHPIKILVLFWLYNSILLISSERQHVYLATIKASRFCDGRMKNNFTFSFILERQKKLEAAAPIY